MLVTCQRYAEDVLKAAGTPAFFVNGDMIVGEAAFEEFDKRIKTLLKN
jgi:protein-disulfide isomerase